jgi:hypothetical protein
MKRVGAILKTIFMLVTMLALILSLTAATYAWFSTNRAVSTDSVTGRTGSDMVELQLSSQGGSAFRGQEEAAIVQVNQTVSTRLMPVSTADLQSFVYSPGTTYDTASGVSVASTFRLVDGENNYYHGRVYIRAVTQSAGVRMALYLDASGVSGGALAQAESGGLLGAARLGLTFNGADPMIFRLSQSENDDQVRNTMINGQLLADGQVLAYENGQVQAVDDPSVLVSQYTISLDGSTVTLPETPLVYLEPNEIYTVDVYFYLEGCDPDCADSISYDSADIHLAFYGLLVDEGAAR